MFDDRILDIVEKFHKRFMTKKVLKTTEEVEANTNETNLVAASVVSELINKLNGCSLEQEGEDFFITGADSVRKKLGEFEVLSGTFTLSYQQTHTIKIKKFPRLILIKEHSTSVSTASFFWSNIENVDSSPHTSFVIKSVSDEEIVFCTVWDSTLIWDYFVLY